MSRPTERRSDRDLMPPPPLPPVRPRPPALFRTHGDTTTPIIVSSPESSDDDEDISSTASSTPHARARGAGNITMRMLDNLRSLLQGAEGGSNCCVVGRIPIGDGVGGQEGEGGVAPITVRFDKSDGSVARLQFPPLPIRNNDLGLEDLLRACSPSSPSSAFGGSRRGEGGGGGSLEAKYFSTDFHPHDCGILDTVAQTLLPQINESIKNKGKDGGDGVQRIRAELIGLEIYPPSTSTTLIKLHLPLDTRQATSSFRTLLILLPTPHLGAQFDLSHPSNTKAQAISTTSTSSSIQYLAFSNLATLSLTPPTSGHLVTLTYNLFPPFPTNLHLQPSSSSSSSSSSFTDPTSFPLYACIKHILSQPDFLPSGGPLGFFCTNNYAHTSRGAEKRFPGCLTGIDYVLFSVFKALGFEPRVSPVLGDEAWDEYYEYRLRKFMEDDREMGQEVPAQQNISRVGKGFGRIRMVDVRIAADEDPTPTVRKFYPFQEIEDVVWLNEARHEGWEVQIVNLKGPGNGDEEGEEGDGGGGLMWHYSCAAILVDVPGFGERRELMEGEEEEEEMSD